MPNCRPWCHIFGFVLLSGVSSAVLPRTFEPWCRLATAHPQKLPAVLHTRCHRMYSPLLPFVGAVWEQEEEEEEKRARARAGSNKRRGILNPYTGEPVDPKLPPTVWVAGAGSDAVDGEYWQGARLRNGAPRYLKTAFDGRRLKICRAKGATSGAHKWWISRLVPKPNPNPNPNERTVPSGSRTAAPP
mmetsp:Transcript_20519/g.50354  ORF Transcript_20519/g.50354 Transcript_20519/m.50354 type:complete len:188 (-) Transcript_20519:2749-3312(-)